MSITKKLEEAILAVDFSQAKSLKETLTMEEFTEEMLHLSYENQNLANYSFITYLLLEEETNDLHDLAFSLMVNPFSHLEGAYYTALFHARKSVEVSGRKDVGSLENLLFLNDVPDQLVSNKEAMEISKEILALDPNNETAKETILELS